MYSTQDHRSSVGLTFQMPSFPARGMRFGAGFPGTEQWGPPMGRFMRGSRGGRGGSIALRGQPTSRYRPQIGEGNQPLKDSSTEGHTNAPPWGPPPYYTRRAEPGRFTRYENPAWGDPPSNAEASPKTGNRAFNEYYGRQRAPSSARTSRPPNPIATCRADLPLLVVELERPQMLHHLHTRVPWIRHQNMMNQRNRRPTQMRTIFRPKNLKDSASWLPILLKNGLNIILR